MMGHDQRDATSWSRWPNRLAARDAPYLLQHADNPVDWYPWGDEALARARAEDRPILLSIGYSACHWCHVMERESFEDARDRRADERALRLHQGRPRGAPRRRRDLHGRRPGDDRPRRLADERVPHARRRAVLRRHLLPARAAPRDAVLAAGAGAASPRPGASSAPRSTSTGERILAAPARAPRALEPAAASSTRPRSTRGRRPAARLRPRARRLSTGAPKFPPASAIEFLLRARGARDGAAHAARDGRGGMYDQVGGGFARYSVDAPGQVPHFEKMLYDNALLARAYLHGFQVTGEPCFARVCTRDARLGAARPAPGGGRLRLARSTPTPRASRASSTSGRRTSCARCSATRTRHRDRVLRPRPARQLRGALGAGARDERPRGAARDRGAAAARCASSASGPRSTTSG